MPRPLLYAQFEDSRYTPQFVGSIYPELKEAQQVLNERYDQAKDTESKLEAARLDLLQNSNIKDRQAAQALFDHNAQQIKDLTVKGDYENLLHPVVSNARKFNVNAVKLLDENKRVQAALKEIDDSKDYNDSHKADLKRLLLSKQNSLSYDPATQTVRGEGFKTDKFAKDVALDQWGNKLAEGFIPDQTAISGGRFVQEKTPDGKRLMFRETNGHKRFVKPEDVREFISNTAKSDSDVNGYLDRLTKQELHKYGEDWRNPNPQNYAVIRQKIEEQHLNPVREAMANKYGFNQTEIKNNYSPDPLDLFKKKLSLGTDYDENKRQTVPSTTMQEGLEKIDLAKLVKDQYKTNAGKTSDFRGMTGSPSISAEAIKGKPLIDLANEKVDGLPKYSGLKMITDLFPKYTGGNTGTNNLGLPTFNKKETEEEYAKRIDPIYKSYLSKIKTHQSYQEDLSAESDKYTDAVLGSKEGEGRTGGGYFSNSPIWIEKDGKFTKYENGKQALADKAITKKDLASFSTTGLNHNYGDFGGAFELVGDIDGKDSKIFVGGSVEHREYSKPMSYIENIINNGEEGVIGTDGKLKIAGQPVVIKVSPVTADNYSLNSKGEFESISPQIEVMGLDGREIYNGDYASFKAEYIAGNKFKDPILNKQRTNTGKETFKDLLKESE